MFVAECSKWSDECSPAKKPRTEYTTGKEENKLDEYFMLRNIGETVLVEKILEKMNSPTLVKTIQSCKDVNKLAIKTLEKGRVRFIGQLYLYTSAPNQHILIIFLNVSAHILQVSQHYLSYFGVLAIPILSRAPTRYMNYLHGLIVNPFMEFPHLQEIKSVAIIFSPAEKEMLLLLPFIRARILDYRRGTQLFEFLETNCNFEELMSEMPYDNQKHTPQQYVQLLKRFNKLKVVVSAKEFKELFEYFISKWIDGKFNVANINCRCRCEQKFSEELPRTDFKHFMLVRPECNISLNNEPPVYIYYIKRIIKEKPRYALFSYNTGQAYFLDITNCEDCNCPGEICLTKLESFIHDNGGSHLKGKIDFKRIARKWSCEAANYSTTGGDLSDLGFAILESVNITYLKNNPEKRYCHWSTLSKS